jgi:hypothetical protein
MFTKYLWPLTVSALLVLAGVALLVAPFALSYQPAHASWNVATETSFWSGIGLIVFALLALFGWFTGLRQAVEEAFAAPEAEEVRQEPLPLKAGKPAVAPTREAQAAEANLDTDEVLRKLAVTVLRDLEERV